MKRQIVALGAFLAGVVLLTIGCDKSTDITIDGLQLDFSGKWSGTYADNAMHGSLSFYLRQDMTSVTGSYVGIDTSGYTGTGTVTGAVSGMNFVGRFTGLSAHPPVIANVSGKFTGNKVGDTLSTTYTATDGLGANLSGTMCLTKQHDSSGVVSRLP